QRRAGGSRDRIRDGRSRAGGGRSRGARSRRLGGRASDHGEHGAKKNPSHGGHQKTLLGGGSAHPSRAAPRKADQPPPGPKTPAESPRCWSVPATTPRYSQVMPPVSARADRSRKRPASSISSRKRSPAGNAAAVRGRYWYAARF